MGLAQAFDIVHDLERLSQTEVEQDAKRYNARKLAAEPAAVVPTPEPCPLTL
jgi:hypothetical protein